MDGWTLDGPLLGQPLLQLLIDTRTRTTRGLPLGGFIRWENNRTHGDTVTKPEGAVLVEHTRWTAYQSFPGFHGWFRGFL